MRKLKFRVSDSVFQSQLEDGERCKISPQVAKTVCVGTTLHRIKNKWLSKVMLDQAEVLLQFLPLVMLRRCIINDITNIRGQILSPCDYLHHILEETGSSIA